MGKPPKAEGSLLDYHGVYSGYLCNLEKQRFIGREGKPAGQRGLGRILWVLSQGMAPLLVF